jgi:enoyl-CoA hydratase/carnithine racemase
VRTDYETIQVEADRGVVTITLNRPEHRNAVTLQMEGELGEAMWGAEGDDDVRAIVVTGAGRSFCSGIDMSEGGFGEDFREQHDRELGVTSDTLWKRYAYWEMSTPVIGAINGAAIGAGLTVALLFDVRFVAEDAKLAFSFTRLGVAPDAGSNWLVPRLVGLERSLDLLMSGRTFSGREAVDWGLCSRALPAADVLAAAQEYAHDIADNTAPLAVAVTKRLIHEFNDASERPHAIGRETKLIWWLGSRPDATEGVMARVEKRPAQWSDSKRTNWPETDRHDA